MTSKDDTFRAFTPAEAAAYASGRGGSYPTQLYQEIFDYHRGQRNVLLDVGTGPGKVVFDLLPFFTQCIGCDTSVQMIEQARKDAMQKGEAVSQKTIFAVAGGEACASILQDKELGSVDVVTVAMTAHWLDIFDFYRSAAKALRSGGTLAIWTCSSYYCHPSMPDHKRIQAIFSDFEDNTLAPYTTPGNRMSRDAYEDLPLPWTVGSGTAGLFDQDSFIRRDWDRHGVPSAPPLADGTPGPYFIASEEATLDSLSAALGSASMVVRWRQAHPHRSNAEDDVVDIAMKRLKEVIGERQSFLASPSCSLLLIRRT